MPSCPHCQSSNVVVTEEVYTRKGRLYYRFWQGVFVFVSIYIGFLVEQLAYGFLAAIAISLVIKVFSLINASKRSRSRTKIICLTCNRKQYLG